MSVRLHIERLVVEEGALSRDQIPLFQAALASELGYLQRPGGVFREAPRDAPSRLAREAAGAIFDRMPKP